MKKIHVRTLQITYDVFNIATLSDHRCHSSLGAPTLAMWCHVLILWLRASTTTFAATGSAPHAPLSLPMICNGLRSGWTTLRSVTSVTGRSGWTCGTPKFDVESSCFHPLRLLFLGTNPSLCPNHAQVFPLKLMCIIMFPCYAQVWRTKLKLRSTACHDCVSSLHHSCYARVAEKNCQLHFKVLRTCTTWDALC